MKNLITILMVMALVSCTNVSDGNNDYLSCEQLLDTTGLKLYPFVPFTDEEWIFLPGEIKVERRQIPEDFLREMTTKELFYQFVYTDLSKGMLASNSSCPDLTLAGPFNMIPELLNRPDAGYVLLELLQKMDPSNIDGLDCFWWDYCLQRIMAQKAVINRMTDEDIDRYIDEQLRCHNAIRNLSKTNKNFEYPVSAAVLLFGLCNVLIRYEFEPFMQMLEMRGKLPYTNEWNWNTKCISEQEALQVIDYVKQFKNRKK